MEAIDGAISGRKQVVVVTGAAGCLGHHLLRLLISHDEKVSEIRCLDVQKQCELKANIIEKELEKQQQLSSSKKKTKKNLKWIQGDIRDMNVVEKCLDGADCVIHCAARIEASVYYAEQNEEELESINVGGTENLLRAAIRLGVPKFIHISSFEAWQGYEMTYYATESTLPIPRCLLFGASGTTKRDAANKVRQYSNNKLHKPTENGQDFLNAIILELPPMYGEFDNHYIKRILETTKFFGGRLRRVSNIWCRQQPLYAGNAAWSIIQAKQRMEKDASISGEEFIITDHTKIIDPFNFIRPYLECKGMEVTRSKYPYFPLWLLMLIFFMLLKLVRFVDIFGLFTRKKSRLDEALNQNKTTYSTTNGLQNGEAQRYWYDYVNPQLLAIMCLTSFFNRNKSSLRLGYEPLFSAEESEKRSLDWYKNHCII